MSSTLGFFLLFANNYSISILPLGSILIILTGILASARLHLKAHNQKEIYLGFFIGLIGQFLGFIML